MWYDDALCKFLHEPQWAEYVAEFLYLVYVIRKTEGFNMIILYDYVHDHAQQFPALSALSTQKFLWRTTVILRKIGGWEKQSVNSHYWRKVSDNKKHRSLIQKTIEMLDSALPRHKTRRAMGVFIEDPGQRTLYDYGVQF